MTRASEFSLRAGLTLLVAALFALTLSAAPQNWDFEPIRAYRKLYFEGLGVTVAATATAFCIGMVLGVFVALARLSRSLAVRHLGDLYVEVIRGTPFIVQVMIAYYGIAAVVAIDNKFLIGSFALGIFAAAYIGEIFRAGIQSIERGQFEAARSLGLSRGQTLRRVVFPQAIKRMIPPLTGELLALTKESSLLFTIGVLELNAAARTAGANTYKQFEAMLVVACVYLTITIPLSMLARWLERRLAKGTRSGLDL